VAETSRLWAEFRLAVVGHLVVGDLDRGQLGAELKSLSAKKWKHPITGKRVTFSYSTIQHWYYVALNNPKARLRALSKKRRDAGIPRSLTKQVRRYLERQAKRHSSWSYRRHYQTLVRHMKERELGRTPGYSTVQRYLRSIFSSQNVSAVGAKIKRLEGLVVHLRRTLIVESTINRLLRVPGASRKDCRSSIQILKARTERKSLRPFSFSRLSVNGRLAIRVLLWHCHFAGHYRTVGSIILAIWRGRTLRANTTQVPKSSQCSGDQGTNTGDLPQSAEYLWHQ
jgi:hypothetical protein